MGRFEKFGDYLFSLLTAPLKKGKKQLNQFYIFFKVIGTLFDDCKKDIFRVRSESMIMTASDVMLPEHGKDRQMPRLRGEGIQSYRIRLSMKWIIAEKAGTKDGILLALAALGYESSYIEPFYTLDPERWAEFIVFLRGKRASGVNDIGVIDAEVMKLKEASAMPSYGVDAGNVVRERSRLDCGFSRYPLCGTIVCGVFPDTTNVGYLIKGTAASGDMSGGAQHNYPLAGGAMASERRYHTEDLTFIKSYGAVLGQASRLDGENVAYRMASEKTLTEGSGRNVKYTDENRT